MTAVAERLEPWQRLADLLIQREALVARVGLGVPPRDFAGMYVDHDDVDRILAGLPGMDGPDAAATTPIVDAMAPAIDDAGNALAEWVGTADVPFTRIARRCGFDVEECTLLALIARVEASIAHQRLLAYVQDSVSLSRVTRGLVMRMFAEAPRLLSPDGRLIRSRLVAFAGDGPWATTMLAPAPRFVDALHGIDAPDSALPPGSRIHVASGGGEAQVVVVSGADALSRRQSGADRAASGRYVVVPPPESREVWDAVVREAAVSGSGVIIEATGPLGPEAVSVIEHVGHLTWVLSFPSDPAVESLPEVPWVEIRLEDGVASPEEWRATLGSGPRGGYRLDRSQLSLVARMRRNGHTDVASAVRRLASGRLDELAIRIRPERSWFDLVLPDDQTAQLCELVARFRHRNTVYRDWGFRAIPSAGLVGVFAGASGTGKTLAAEVVAGNLGLDLYKIDLSAVVSKYIGETEKNLERIFDAASAGEVVLFFDEADALFGKRSEVSDSHDRYANIEVAYLLQRLESYDGLVVLATNLQRNMDHAFLRRIHVSVEFPLPDEEGREAIWRLSLPPTAPVGDVDFRFLAHQFKLSGGSIRNAALAAAFLAADSGTGISMEHVMLGLKREFQKLGRLRTEAEFDRYWHLVHDEPEPVGVE